MVIVDQKANPVHAERNIRFDFAPEADPKFIIKRLTIREVCLITPRRFNDARGYFSETYNRRELALLGIDSDFSQDNESLSEHVGTLRGLHFQRPPFAQAKLIRVLSGSIFDVAVDLRAGSPTFGKWCSAMLSAENRTQIYIPKGFAHGFCTLQPQTLVSYKVDSAYNPKFESGVIWKDSELAIPWPIASDQILLSEKDKDLPLLKDLDPAFFC